MIETRNFVPFRFGVAILTALTLRSLVHVVGQVTRDACLQGSRIENSLYVAVVAGSSLVGAVEQEIGVVIVIELDFRPDLIRMTSFTSDSVVTIMIIVIQMTADTFCFQLITEGVLAMAAVACQ
jgi:hypothetical protein